MSFHVSATLTMLCARAARVQASIDALLAHGRHVDERVVSNLVDVFTKRDTMLAYVRREQHLLADYLN